MRDHKDAEVHINGYTIFRVDNTKAKKNRGRDSGGVSVYVRNDIANTFEQTVTFSNGAVDLIAIHSHIEKLHISASTANPTVRLIDPLPPHSDKLSTNSTLNYPKYNNKIS